MAKLSKDYSAGTLHPRETLFTSGNLAAQNAEIILPVDGCASVVFDLRGTFNLEFIIEATADGTNWQAVATRPINGNPVNALRVNGNTAGTWVGSIAGFRFARARCSNYGSGLGVGVLSANTAPADQSQIGAVTPLLGTAVGAVGAVTTLTLAAPAVGLRHYLTSLSINRFATAALTAGAVPVTITTTNLPGNAAFSFAADAALQGTLDRWREDFTYPIAATAQATATTIVCPATPNIIWRITAGFYVAP